MPPLKDQNGRASQGNQDRFLEMLRFNYIKTEVKTKINDSS